MARLRITSIYFFVFIFVMIALRHLFFISVLQLNKNSFKSKAIIDGTIQTVRISKNELYKNTTELTWKDKNKELKINDKMYEVIYIKKSLSGYCIYLLEDLMESNWLNKITQLNEPKNTPLKDLFNLFSQLNFYEPISHYLFVFFILKEIKIPFFKIALNLSDYHFKLIKPPCF